MSTLYTACAQWHICLPILKFGDPMKALRGDLITNIAKAAWWDGMDYTRDARGSLCFASGQGGAEEKNRGGAGRGRAGSKILVAGRGQSNPTRAFSGWDKKTINREVQVSVFFSTNMIFFVVFCLFFIHHLVHFLSGSTGRAWRGVHPWIILLRLLLNYTWLLDYKSTSVYSVSSILIHLTWKINFIKRSGKYSIASAHAWNCNRTKRLLLWVSFAWRGTHGGFFAIDY